MNNLLKILQICDSLFPVGAFTLSNGLETYVQNGLITTAEGLGEYVDSYIKILPFNELGSAFLAYSCKSEEEIIYLDEIYTAVKVPEEIRKGSQKTAKAFFRISENFGDTDRLKKYGILVSDEKCFGHQSIAFGLYFSDCKVEISDALEIYAYSIISQIVTNCVKLVPLSQIAGQKILNENLKKIPFAVEKSLETKIEDLGIGGAGFDIRGMEHEKLYSRQFMS